MPTIALRGMKMTGSAVGKPDGAPSHWHTVMRVDHSHATVSFAMRGGISIVTCNSGVDNYTVESGSQNTDHVADLDVTRITQRIWFTSKLPSTDDSNYAVRLVSQTGDARFLSVSLDHVGRDAGDSNRVLYVEITLQDVDGDVAPFVGATYTFEITFSKIA